MKKNNNDEPTIELLKKIFDNLNQHWHSIELLLAHVSNPLTVDDRGLANALRCITEKTNKNIELINNLDITHTLAEIKYIGNRLKTIEEDIAEIKNKGVDYKVNLQFSHDQKEKPEITKKPMKTKGKRK